MSAMPQLPIRIVEATRAHAQEVAEIHLSARREGMPYLRSVYTEADTRKWFARTVGEPPASWWIAIYGDRFAAYMAVRGEYLDHLYVRPGLQRRRIGLALLDRAKALSPRLLKLRAFQRNTNARSFYEAQGFEIVGFTEGENDEREPDVKYVWRPERRRRQLPGLARG